MQEKVNTLLEMQQPLAKNSKEAYALNQWINNEIDLQNKELELQINNSLVTLGQDKQ